MGLLVVLSLDRYTVYQRVLLLNYTILSNPCLKRQQLMFMTSAPATHKKLIMFSGKTFTYVHLVSFYHYFTYVLRWDWE